MKITNKISKTVFGFLFAITFSPASITAQNDTMYIMKSGNVIFQNKVTEIDSIIFYKPIISPNNNIVTVQIPAGTFTMGSPINEVNRINNETQHQVTLSAFRMSKYEITNAQYASFLNAKSIGSNALYAAGTYPTQVLISANSTLGLQYVGSQWTPVAGCENKPVINVTWYGASEFAAYVGGSLPTEAQWEYACRGNTTTPFNTGNCLNNTQTNYTWSAPYNTCTNSFTNSPGTTQTVGSYAANGYGLFDMHGNVWEWCSDWFGTYSASAQTNPTGAVSGTYRVSRGGSYDDSAQYCRSAYRNYDSPSSNNAFVGFRIVLVP